MKAGKGHFILAITVFFCLCLAIGLALGGYFRSVEVSSANGKSEKKLLAQLHVFHDQLKSTESPEQAKTALKNLEISGGFGPESEALREVKKVYGPVISLFGSKPREAEPRHLLAKKKELLDLLVNSYRKEIPHGDIRVRASYLNLLFDLQNSLLNDNDETELVFLKRNHERLEGLKSLATGGADGLPDRIAAVEQGYASYERSFEEATKWRNNKSETLLKLEHELPALTKRLISTDEAGLDDTRRSFLYVGCITAAIVFFSFLALLIGHKLLRLRAELKAEEFIRYLRGFGAEHLDSQTERAIASLKEDAGWAPILAEAQRAEQDFVQHYQTLLAVPRTLQAPYLVFGKDKVLKLWNDSASRLFGLNAGKIYGLPDVLTADVVRSREGEHAAVVELLNSSHAGLGNEKVELSVRQGSDWVPFELQTNPITSGPLTGGRIYLWREIRSESERLEKAVAFQLSRARELVRKVAASGDAEVSPAPGDSEAVKDILVELDNMRRRLGEKELLWKTESQALADQVVRQQEILQRLGEELGGARGDYAEVLQLVRSAKSADEHWHDEVCVVERDLERWTANRKRLLSELKQQSVTLEKAKTFEEQLRISTNAVKKALESFEADLEELRQFAETARVHAVNVSLVRDPGYWEFASRSRAFAQDLVQFTDRAGLLAGKVQDFLSGHPGGALAAHLSGGGVDAVVLDSLVEEQEKIAASLKRWRENGEAALQTAEKALALLQDAEKKNALATQLGETSLLINEQAQGNLGRWN
jgi:hypothetical protein